MNNNNYIHPGSISISIPDKMESKNVSKSFCDNEEDEQEEKIKIFDFSVLTNIRFLGFCITMLLSSLAEQSAFVFLPAFAEEIGVLGDQSSEYTVAITSVFSSLAKVLTGFLFDCSLVKPYRVYLYNVLMSGLVVISFVIPSVTTFSQLAIVCGLYGLCAGSYKAQKSVVIVDILGREKLKHSFGILMMFQGIGSLIGPPLSGN
jgi:MFS family permease